MNKQIFCLVLGFVLVSLTTQQPTALIELCRHGSRGPLNNTYDPTWSDDELGELTPVGMRQHYILGTILGMQYPTILNSTNPNDIYMIADNITRCAQSAISQSFGIWNGDGPGLGSGYPAALAIPPCDVLAAQKIALNLSDSYAIPNNYYPPPIITVNDETVYFFNSYGFCPEIIAQQATLLQDSDAQELWAMAQPTVQYINSVSSVPVNSFMDLMTFADTVLSNLIVAKPLPGNIPLSNLPILTNISFLTDWGFYHVFYGNPEVTALGAGVLINEIIQLIENALTGNNFTPFSLLSGHDTNVGAFMAVIGYYNESCILANWNAALNGQLLPPYPLCYYPPFASTIKVEVYNTSNPYIIIKYNDVVVPLCGPSGMCPVNQFIQIALNGISQYTTSQVISTCQQQLETKAAPKPTEAFVVSEVENFNLSSMIQNIMIALLSMTTIFLLVKNVNDKRKYEAELERVRGIMI